MYLVGKIKKVYADVKNVQIGIVQNNSAMFNLFCYLLVLFCAYCFDHIVYHFQHKT